MKTTLLTLFLSTKILISFGQDLRTFFELDKYGVKNLKGDIILPAKYDRIWITSNKWILLNIGTKGYNFDNNKPPKLSSAGSWGLADQNGKIIVDPKYDAIDFDNIFKYGVVRVCSGSTPLSKQLINELKDKGYKFDYPVVGVDWYGGKWGLIDKEGKEVLTPKYEYIGQFHEGFAQVTKGGEFIIGFGKILVVDILFRHSGYGGKTGFIDITGQETIPCIYDRVENFQNGKARVTLNGRTFYIDKNGNEIKE
jgi:hypothetical protein